MHKFLRTMTAAAVAAAMAPAFAVDATYNVDVVVYHRWEDGDWFCINKSGSIVKCPSSSNQESRS